ncbi:hypothetical protein GW932_03385 [archaeon]|nr:hypothetical protein [archaeon]
MKFEEKRKELDKIEISFLEKFIINWAMPFEFVGCHFMSKIYGDDYSLDPYLKNGFWNGLVLSKVDDYKRIIQSKEKYGNKDKMLIQYDKTPCGKVMVLTHNFFRS